MLNLLCLCNRRHNEKVSDSHRPQGARQIQTDYRLQHICRHAGSDLRAISEKYDCKLGFLVNWIKISHFVRDDKSLILLSFQAKRGIFLRK
jgi:hypothetical protein